jgi:hypothetical protein
MTASSSSVGVALALERCAYVIIEWEERNNTTEAHFDDY